MPTKETTPAKSFYDFTLQSIQGEPIDFNAFRGKKVLVVNVASRCGFTKQYAGLEKLHRQYGEKVVVLGFPANDFGRQEPGSNSEIASFCQMTYDVTFPLFEKIAVTGKEQHPFYQWLVQEGLSRFNDPGPQWNFTKYLISEEGMLLNIFSPNQEPFSKEVIAAVTGKQTDLPQDN